MKGGCTCQFNWKKRQKMSPQPAFSGSLIEETLESREFRFFVHHVFRQKHLLKSEDETLLSENKAFYSLVSSGSK